MDLTGLGGSLGPSLNATYILAGYSNHDIPGSASPACASQLDVAFACSDPGVLCEQEDASECGCCSWRLYLANWWGFGAGPGGNTDLIAVMSIYQPGIVCGALADDEQLILFSLVVPNVIEDATYGNRHVIFSAYRSWPEGAGCNIDDGGGGFTMHPSAHWSPAPFPGVTHPDVDFSGAAITGVLH